MVLLTIVAGIAANWINLFLPSFVILIVNVIPAFQRGARWKGAAVTVTWTFVLASAAAVSSGIKIYSKLVPTVAELTTTTTTTTTMQHGSPPLTVLSEVLK